MTANLAWIITVFAVGLVAYTLGWYLGSFSQAHKDSQIINNICNILNEKADKSE